MASWSATLRELGPAGFATYAASRAAALIPGVALHSYVLIAVPRSGMPDLQRGFVIRELDAATVAENAASLELPLAAVHHRMGQGMTCLAALRDDQIAGVTFLTDQAFDEDELAVRFVPPAGAAWDTGLYVRPGSRGGRAFAALWAGTANWLAERGLDWSVSRIAHYNTASIAAHRRMGGVITGTLHGLRVGGKQWLSAPSAVIGPELP